MRTQKLSIAIMTATALFCLAACNQKPESKILAKVNGITLTAGDVGFRLEQAHGKNPQYGQKGIDDIINQELLFQKGMQLGLDKDPSYQRTLVALKSKPQGARRLEMARRVFNTQIASTIEVTGQETKDYYEKNADQIATELHLEMIRFDSKAQAEEALLKLHGGADFASIARPVMTGPKVEGREPWDLGFVKWEQVPVDYLEPIYKLNPGELSPVLGWQPTGFQVVKMLAKRTLPRAGYEKKSASVMNRLRDQKLLHAYHAYLETLRKEAKIVTF